MKILAIADVEDRAIWDFYKPGMFEGIDLIISCGDLDRRYLEFIESMANVPLLYICGNHDSGYEKNPPEGCVCIEDMIYNFHGLRILGLGGSMRYKPGPYMYTEREMQKRISRLKPEMRLKNGFDILVTHAPAKGWGDLEDLPHNGFQCFNDLLDKYHPKYMLHGHVHQTYGGFQRARNHPSGTKIINAYDKFLLEISPDEYPEYGKTGSFIYDLYMRLAVRGA